MDVINDPACYWQEMDAFATFQSPADFILAYTLVGRQGAVLADSSSACIIVAYLDEFFAGN